MLPESDYPSYYRFIESKAEAFEFEGVNFSVLIDSTAFQLHVKKDKKNSNIIKDYLLIILKVIKGVLMPKPRLSVTPIVFIEYYANNLNHTLPIFLNYDNSIFIASRRTVSKRLAYNYPGLIELEHFISVGFFEFWKLNRTISKYLLRLDQCMPVDLMRIHRKHRQRLKMGMIEAFLTFLALNRILSLTLPKYLIITGEHSVDSRIASFITKRLGGKVIQVQHGIFKNLSDIRVKRYSDVFFVWDSYFARLIKDNQDTEVVVSGNIAIQHFLSSNRTARYKSNSVLIVSTPPSGVFVDQALYDRLLNSYFGVAKKLNDLKFYYKPHPSESNFTLNGAPTNFEISTDNIYELLASCEIVIGVTSSVCFEVEFFNKPLIIVDIGQSRLFPFYNECLKALPGDVDSLAACITSSKNKYSESQYPIENGIEIVKDYLKEIK